MYEFSLDKNHVISLKTVTPNLFRVFAIPVDRYSFKQKNIDCAQSQFFDTILVGKFKTFSVWIFYPSNFSIVVNLNFIDVISDF